MRNAMKLLAMLLACTPALAADWTQWRGPSRDGTSPEKGLLRKWPASGPKLLWKSDKAGGGLAGMAVVGGVVYTMGTRGTDEYALAFDKAGKILWESKLGPVLIWEGNTWSRGPISTPSISGKHGYFLTSKGVLACLTIADGKEVWKKDLPKDMGAVVNNILGFPTSQGYGWGFTWSPAVVADGLLIAPGGPKGLLALLDASTGKEKWRSKDIKDQATYGSPTTGKVGGQEMAFYVTQDGFVAASMKDGSLIYRNKRDQPYPDVVCAMPLVVGDTVLCSIGYGGGSAEKYKWDGKTFKPVWTDKREIGSRQGGTVVVGKTIYGYHDASAWMCQDLESGELLWGRKRQKLKAGAVIAADGLLFALDETGRAGLMEATPKAYSLLGDFVLPQKGSRVGLPGLKVWTHPSLSDGKLYLRDQQWLFCYQVK